MLNWISEPIYWTLFLLLQGLSAVVLLGALMHTPLLRFADKFRFSPSFMGRFLCVHSVLNAKAVGIRSLVPVVLVRCVNTKYRSVIKIPLMLCFSSVALFSFAGGMEFMADDTSAQGPAYFGFVKDEQGNIIKSASVIVTAKSFGAAGVTATFTTNVLGLYRGHIHQEAQTEILKLTCLKDGYRQTKVIRKSKTNKFLETDCIMQKR